MIEIKDYKTLRKFIKKFKTEHFDLLILVSRGGLGKTFNTNKILNGTTCKINSHITPKGLVILGHKYKNKLMWFDDVEVLFNNDKLVGLLKQFAQTQDVKHIKYLTSCIMKSEGEVIPHEYDTKSKILMTCNNLTRIKNPSIKALLDRGLIINFNPSKEEVVHYIKDSFEEVDYEVLDYISQMEVFSLRDYIKALQLKKAKFKDWQEMLSN